MGDSQGDIEGLRRQCEELRRQLEDLHAGAGGNRELYKVCGVVVDGRRRRA